MKKSNREVLEKTIGQIKKREDGLRGKDN